MSIRCTAQMRVATAMALRVAKRVTCISALVLLNSCLVTWGYFVRADEVLIQRLEAWPSQHAAKTLKAEAKFSIELPDKALSMAMSANGNLIAMATDSAKIFAWDLSSDKEVGRWDCGPKTTVVGLAFSGSGKQLLARLSRSANIVKVWEISTRREVYAFPFNVGIVRFDPSDTQVVCVQYFGKVLYRDSKDGALIREAKGHDVPNGAYDLSPDCKLLAMAPPNRTIKVRNLETEKDFIISDVPEKSLVHFTPGGKLYATSQPAKSITFYDSHKGIVLHKIPYSGAPGRLAFGANDKWLAETTFDKANLVTIREVATGKELLTFERAPGQPLAFGFNPKGNLLVTSSDNIVQVWEISEKKAPPGKSDPPAKSR